MRPRLVQRANPLAAPTPGVSRSLDLEDLRPPDEWKALVGAATTAIGSGRLEKVVLARAVRASADGPFDLAAAQIRGHPDC